MLFLLAAHDKHLLAVIGHRSYISIIRPVSFKEVAGQLNTWIDIGYPDDAKTDFFASVFVLVGMLLVLLDNGVLNGLVEMLFRRFAFSRYL